MIRELAIPCCAAGVLISCNRSQADSKQNTGLENELYKGYNILWISCEDISCMLSMYGDSTVSTPNLDQLAREGITYQNVFSVSGVSAPSRSALITGMYPTSVGTQHMRTNGDPAYQPVPPYSAVLPPEVKCFSEILRENGYYCSNNAKEDYQFVAPVTAWDESSRNAHWRNRPKGKPFFSVFNIELTHESRIWKHDSLPLRVNPSEVSLPPYYPDNPIVRHDVARAYSNISLMDSVVGNILNELKEDDLLENTVIFFFSDNGGPLPRQKREIYDSGIKVPLIIRFPKKREAGTSKHNLVSFVDFAPTVLSLVGIPIPEYIQGLPFLGIFHDENRRYIFAARDRMDTEYDMVRAVRSNEYKYIKNYFPDKPYIQNIEYRLSMKMMCELMRLDSLKQLNWEESLWFAKHKPVEEMYDIRNDPYELNNLAENPFYLSIMQELRKELVFFQDEFGDKGYIPEVDMLKQMWNFQDQSPETSEVRFSLKRNRKLCMKSDTRGASIGFKISSKAASSSWMVYSEPIQVASHDTIFAISNRIGYKPSRISYFVMP